MYRYEKKKIPPKMLNKYVRDMIRKDSNIQLSERDMYKVFDSMEYAIKELLMSGYSFKLFGVKFNMEHVDPVIYRDVRDREIKLSRPYLKLKVRVPEEFQRAIKERTRYDSSQPPKLLGVTKEELPRDMLSIFEEEL